MDEKHAIQRQKEGDIHGLEFLVNQFQLRAIRVAYLITRDLGMAEEIVQESFVKAYRSIHSFDGNRPFGPWFMRNVVNGSVKMMQRSARQRAVIVQRYFLEMNEKEMAEESGAAPTPAYLARSL